MASADPALSGAVVYMNAAAERQIRTGNSIRIVNNRIVATYLAARAALSKAIDEAARDDITPCQADLLRLLQNSTPPVRAPLAH